MLHNYLTIALRNLLRHKGYACINVGGLAVGIACCLLILLYIQYELSYDRFPAGADRIYRVVREERAPGRVTSLAITPGPLAPALQREFPEIQQVVRLKPPNAAWMLRHEDRSFYETSFYIADSTVFDVFSIPLLKGNPATALQRPYTVVLTEAMARKYFGEEEPIGKLIRAEESMDLEVTGVMPSLPSNSHLKFEILASMGTQEELDRQNNQTYLTRWRSNYNFYTYVVLAPGADPSRLEQKLPALIEKYAGSELRAAGVTMRFSLQPLAAIHLHSHLERELSANSDVASIYLFSAIAVFILLIACINFMNLATAHATMRAKEVGIRKVVGGQRHQLIIQFLGESLVVSCFAALLALGVAKLLVPVFNILAGKAIPGDLLTNGTALAGLAGITLVVGLVAGAYPAFVLSAFRPAAVIAGMRGAGRARSRLRKALVVAQFTITIALMICTGIVLEQLRYIRSRDLGLDPAQMVVMPLTYPPFSQRYSAFKQQVLQHPAVLGVTRSHFAPGRWNNVSYSLYQSAKAPMTESVEMCTLGADEDFVATMGMTLVAGRFLERPAGAEPEPAYVLTEAAVTRLGWFSPEDAIGQSIDWLPPAGGRRPSTIVGVVNDVHLRSLHDRIEPVVFYYTLGGAYIYVKIAAAQMPETLAFLRQTWKRVNPNAAFEYRFMDEEFARLYEAEERLGTLVGGFALLAVVIGCLGLFGLASFTVTQRTKEIGIRKVLGASIPNLIRLISKEFLLLVAVSNLLAWPVAYYAMSRWLQNFAYRIDIGAGVFVLAAVMALAVALATVGGHALRAARTNPVEALRYE
jgi:putative ABC transport system permease protein